MISSVMMAAALAAMRTSVMMLGLYMWDFGGAFGPVSGEKMKAQLAVAGRLLQEGTVEGLVFHPTISADMDVPAVLPLAMAI